MDRGIALSEEVRSDRSIALYWVIACCDWVGGVSLSCSDSEAASDVRLYLLRKPWQINSSGTFRGSDSGWSCAPYCVVGAVLCSGIRGSYWMGLDA